MHHPEPYVADATTIGSCELSRTVIRQARSPANRSAMKSVVRSLLRICPPLRRRLLLCRQYACLCNSSNTIPLLMGTIIWIFGRLNRPGLAPGARRVPLSPFFVGERLLRACTTHTTRVMSRIFSLGYSLLDFLLDFVQACCIL